MARGQTRVAALMVLAGTFAALAALALPRLGQPQPSVSFGQINPYNRQITFFYIDPARNLRGTTPSPLRGQQSRYADLAPDGRRVASISTDDTFDLFIVERDSSQRRLTDVKTFPPDSLGRAARRYNLFPAWSPDGEWIAFFSSHTSGQVDLFLIQPDGSGLRQLSGDLLIRNPLRPQWVKLDGGFPADLLAALAACGAGLAALVWRAKTPPPNPVPKALERGKSTSPPAPLAANGEGKNRAASYALPQHFEEGE